MGVRAEDFDQTRMIPIKVYYTDGDKKKNILPTLYKLEIGDVDVKMIKQDYLIPVGLEEEKTGNEEIDALIEKLNAVYKKFSEGKALPSEKASKNEQLNALFKAIRQLQMRQNIKPLLLQAQILNKQIEKTLAEYTEQWENIPDATAISDEEMEEYLKKLRAAQDAIDTYTTLDTDLDFLLEGEDLSEEDEKLKKDLSKASGDARKLKVKLEKVKGKFVEKVVAASVGVEKVLALRK